MSRTPIVISFLAWLFLFVGCTSIPAQRSAVNDVSVRGSNDISSSDIEEKLATSATPKFLGLFRGVLYEYELFNRATLQRDLARVERFYHARGYYDALVTAGLVTRVDKNHVRVEIEVKEGQPVRNYLLKVEGLGAVPKEIADAALAAARGDLPDNEPFDEEKFKKAEEDLTRALTDRGYAYTKVERDAIVDVVTHRATSVFSVVPGPPSKFGKITIVARNLGTNQPLPLEIPEAPLRRAIDIRRGDPYSSAEIQSATQALLDLGIFSSVDIEPDLPETPNPSGEVPITVKVEPSRLRQIKLGGGIEFDVIKTDVHGLIGWENRNFFGGLRTFSVEFRPGGVLYPIRLGNIVKPTNFLPEEKLRLLLTQPGFIEARTNGNLRPEFNVFALLVSPDPAPDAPVIGYREFKNAAYLDRTYGKSYTSFGHNLQVENPFAYVRALDPDLPTLVISYPELITTLDFRDDKVHPHKGIYLSDSFQVAGGPFGGNAADLKVQPEVRTYIPVASKVTFATRASIGFLFPRNYGNDVENLPVSNTDPDRAAHIRDIQTVMFRGFFSGGPSSNRGYPYRGVSPHGFVPFLNPATAAQQNAANCDPTNPPLDPVTRMPLPIDPQQCSIPIGGFTLWEFSNELRVAVSGPISAAVFCDMSDVSQKTAQLRLSHLHMSCGVGARYDTPVGPIRLDVGYRIQPLQVLGYQNEQDVYDAMPVEGLPQRLLGIPLAVAFGIGEAY
jgi:outer membrane protein insertion porin family/translocation and assembly module TamA